MKIYLFLLCYCLALGNLYAQKSASEENRQTIELNEVVVTGTGTEYYLKDAPVQTEVISKQTLSAYSGRSLEDLLGGLSASFDFNPNDMGSNIQLNGLGNSYILILIDGKRLNGDVGGQNDLSFINPADIERIEIVKGASSSLYGSDAIAGVINIITKKHFNLVNLENSTRTGSYGDLQQHNTIAFSKGKWTSTSKFALKHSDGWRNTTEEWYRNTIYQNSVTKTANRFTDYKISEKISYKANERLLFNLQGSYYGKDIFRLCGEPQYRTFGMFYRRQSYDLDAKYDLGNKNNLFFETSYDKNNYYHRYTHPTVEEFIDKEGAIFHPVFYSGDTSLQSSQERFFSHLKGVFNLGTQHRISLGIEHIFDVLKSPYRILSDKESAYTLSAYAQEEWSLSDNFNITAGLRLVNHKEFGTKLTPKISALYKIQDFGLRATYSNGFKTPTLKELYYRYERTMMSRLRLYLGNTDLQPQRSNYFSTGIEYNTKKFTSSVTGYYNRIIDMIELVEIETAFYDKVRDVERTMQYQNIEDAKIKGIDFLFNVNPNKNLVIGGGYSYVYARTNKLNEDGIIEHIMLDGTALHRANFRGVWNRDWKKYNLGIGLFGRIQSKRFYRYYGDTDAYSTWRLNTNHKVKGLKKYKLEFNVGIDNILDYHETKPYGYNYSTNSPGRTYYASVLFQFAKK